MPEEKKERKVRRANRKINELTLNEQRIKYLRQLSKAKGIISRTKERYDAITPHKISKKPELKETKAEYKKLYDKAEKRREELSILLKEIDKTIKEAKKLKEEGKDTSHLNVKFKGKKGRPKKDPAEVKYITTITPGPPLEKNDYTKEEWSKLLPLNAKKNGALAYLKRIDDIRAKSEAEGKEFKYNEEEYKERKKHAKDIIKEIDAIQYIVRERVGKQDIIVKTIKPNKEKKPRGRPKKEQPIVEKKPRGRPKKPVVEKKPRGRPKKNAELAELETKIKDMNKEEEDDMQKYKEMMKKPKKDYNAKISKLDKMMKDMKEQDDNDMQRYKEMMEKPKKNYNAKIAKLDKMMKDMKEDDDNDMQRYKEMMKKPKYVNNVINTNIDDVVETVVKAVVKEVVEVMDIIPKHVKVMNEAHRRALLADMKAKREAYERWKNRTAAEIIEDRIKAEKELIERYTREPIMEHMNDDTDINGVRLPPIRGRRRRVRRIEREPLEYNRANDPAIVWEGEARPDDWEPVVTDDELYI